MEKDTLFILGSRANKALGFGQTRGQTSKRDFRKLFAGMQTLDLKQNLDGNPASIKTYWGDMKLQATLGPL